MKDAQGHGSNGGDQFGQNYAKPGQQWKTGSSSDAKFVSDLQAAKALSQNHPKTAPPSAAWYQMKPGDLGPDPERANLYAKLSARATPSGGMSRSTIRGIIGG